MKRTKNTVNYNGLSSSSRKHGHQRQKMAKDFEIDEASTPLKDLKAAQDGIKIYSGVPETPTPRRNRVDHQLNIAQQKMEYCLHSLTSYVEDGKMVDLGQAMAWARSSYEDIHQERRRYMAGRQAWKLDQRQDENKGTLLSQEESKRITRMQDSKSSNQGRGRTFRPEWARQEQRSRFRSRSFSTSRSTKGGGKGSKGKGKGQK